MTQNTNQQFPPSAPLMLLEYARYHEQHSEHQTPRLHTYNPVKFTVKLSAAGEMIDIQYHDKKLKHTRLLPAVKSGRGNVPVPKLVSDNLSYVVSGIREKNHAAYLKLLEQYQHIPEINAVL